ncbi:MAG TPA: carboxypeptidase-like regulatory domain-containing protein, partial [Pyrinomonadaceae bacterium]|nr:carboxypeptidase-like regulatory domain-containing protein [Pyrinomonadaceae bacterium]
MAQALTGGLRGTTYEFLGAVVPNAKITIRLKDKDEDEKSARPKFRKPGDEEFTRTTTGNEAGEFNFSDLPAGVYEIEASTANGSSFKGRWFGVTAGKTNQYSIEFGTDCNNDTGKTIDISNAEKAEIVNQFLENAILKKALPDYGMLEQQKGPIIVSTEDIKPELIKSFENVKLMNAREVQQ